MSITTDWAALYEDLHRHPELSFEENRTAGIVADSLRESGFEVETGVGRTGVVGVMRNGDGPTVLVRADMDALPVTEDTGLAYSSTVEGVAHACGHDVHTTALLGAALVKQHHPSHVHHLPLLPQCRGARVMTRLPRQW